jgi:hypothetical protein
VQLDDDYKWDNWDADGYGKNRTILPGDTLTIIPNAGKKQDKKKKRSGAKKGKKERKRGEKEREQKDGPPFLLIHPPTHLFPLISLSPLHFF